MFFLIRIETQDIKIIVFKFEWNKSRGAGNNAMIY